MVSLHALIHTLSLTHSILGITTSSVDSRVRIASSVAFRLEFMTQLWLLSFPLVDVFFAASTLPPSPLLLFLSDLPWWRRALPSLRCTDADLLPLDPAVLSNRC